MYSVVRQAGIFSAPGLFGELSRFAEDKERQTVDPTRYALSTQGQGRVEITLTAAKSVPIAPSRATAGCRPALDPDFKVGK